MMRLSFGSVQFLIVCSRTEQNYFYSYYKTNGHSLTHVTPSKYCNKPTIHISPWGSSASVTPILYGLRQGANKCMRAHTYRHTELKVFMFPTQPCLGGLLQFLLWFIVLVTLCFGFFRTGVSKLGPVEFSSNPNQTHLNQLI